MYTTKSRIQNFLLINIDDSFESQITEWISVVTAYINNYCGTEFEQESATYKLYDGDGTDELMVDDLITLTKVDILDYNGDVLYTIDSATDEYHLYPANTTPKTMIKINRGGAPVGIFLCGNQNIKVTGTFGYAATVPEDIRFVATKLVASIIEEGNYDVGAEIKSEKLGEYSITYQDIEKIASDNLDIFKILDQHKVLKV